MLSSVAAAFDIVRNMYNLRARLLFVSGFMWTRSTCWIHMAHKLKSIAFCKLTLQARVAAERQPALFGVLSVFRKKYLWRWSGCDDHRWKYWLGKSRRSNRFYEHWTAVVKGGIGDTLAGKQDREGEKEEACVSSFPKDNIWSRMTTAGFALSVRRRPLPLSAA